MMDVDKELASLGFPLRQDPIAGFQNGACLDLRLRFAMQLLSSSPMVDKMAHVNGASAVQARMMATFALDVADELFKQAHARGLITPLPEDSSLDAATKAHGERAGAFSVAQQVGAKKAAEEANGPIATLRRPGMNG